jgi:formylglycine-generating enzyme required for sulfatase activity
MNRSWVGLIAAVGVFSFGSCGKKQEAAPSGEPPAQVVAAPGKGLSAVDKSAGEFALIPAGGFLMGDAVDDMKRAPLRTVYVSAFWMAKHEVTKAQWDEVMAWSMSHGYTDLPSGSGKAADHPVHTISWYEAVKWCNARSEKERRIPCYTVSEAVYRTGKSDPACNWKANGYRLPSEAEWEKAARGGLSGKRYPSGDSIGTTEANYSFEGNPWVTESTPQTSPVGSYPANGYGLFDTAGNVWEVCWDWFGDYPTSDNSTDPRGPTSGTDRVRRGGSWRRNAFFCRVGQRYGDFPDSASHGIGFRVAHSAAP